jgi:hypothetical protein
MRTTSIYLLALLIAIQGCGFAVEEHLTGPYYLISIDTDNDLDVSYRLGTGDYIGRIPEKVVEVGFNDSLLIGKSINANNISIYYIIDRKKDYPLAKETEYLIDTMSEDKYRLKEHTFSVKLKKIVKRRHLFGNKTDLE